MRLHGEFACFGTEFKLLVILHYFDDFVSYFDVSLKKVSLRIQTLFSLHKCWFYALFSLKSEYVYIYFIYHALHLKLVFLSLLEIFTFAQS